MQYIKNSRLRTLLLICAGALLVLGCIFVFASGLFGRENSSQNGDTSNNQVLFPSTDISADDEGKGSRSGGSFPFFNSKKQFCPDEMIVNEMPGVDRSGEQDSADSPMRSSYYTWKGERYELEEFDIVWVGNNCNVPVISVY